MTPAQIERASELLSDREGVVDTIKSINELKRFRIEGSRTVKGETLEHDREYFLSIGDAMDMTPAVRKLLLTAPQAMLAAIDTELKGQGVILSATEAVNAAA